MNIHPAAKKEAFFFNPLKRTSLLIRLACVPWQIAACFYMKLLHICRGDEFFKITLNASKINHPLKCLLNLNVSKKSCYCIYILKGTNYRFFGLFVKIYFKNNFFFTKASVAFLIRIFRFAFLIFIDLWLTFMILFFKN